MQRYSRHLIMPEVGVEGQRKLKAARVLCVGAGGLGAPAAMYLAAAGVGTLGLVDFDVVDASNLHRQMIYGTTGRRASRSWRPRAIGCTAMNPVSEGRDARDGAHLEERARRPARTTTSSSTAPTTFQTRYLVNDACVLLGKPNVYGSIFRFDGQASVFAVKGGPCYRCLYPEPPPPGLVPSCAEGGVLGVLPGVIGIIQATEAIKLILGGGQPLVGRLLLYDALQMRFRELKLRRDPECPVCGDHPTIHELIDYDQFCGVVPAQAAAGGERRAGGDRRGAEGASSIEARTSSCSTFASRNEYQICRIAGVDADPARRAAAADRRARVATARWSCTARWAARSAKAVALLQERGFTRVSNLKGGILAWIDRVDPSQSKVTRGPGAYFRRSGSRRSDGPS